ncbi:MAG TPA: hypothetical protein VF331_17185 [Polyangiales bacterium]
MQVTHEKLVGPRFARSVALALALCVGTLLSAPGARAEEEAPDSTRLDVERLPPEAIATTRDMYAVGWHVRAELGGQGLVGGAGRLVQPGPVARVGFGYEPAPFFALAALVGMGFHPTDAAPPPAATAVQLYNVLLQAKLQLALGTRSALWLAGEAGLGWASGDFLQAYGLRHAGDPGAAYGGSLGVDWHLFNAHHSLGLCASAHLLPNLNGRDGERALALGSAAYLKYVF